MGRNAAFGRAPALDRIRGWWDAQDPATRTNALLALGVGVLVVGILVAAVSRDTSPTRPAAKVIRPPLQTLVPGSPSTVVIDGLNAPGTPTTSSSSSTTTSTLPPTTTATTPPITTAPPVVTTAAPAPATTATNPDVVFNDVSTTTVAPVVTTLPTSTTPPTSTRPATTTTTTGLPLPLQVPRLLEPG